MTNKEIARVLDDLGDMLEIQDAGVFGVIAMKLYRALKVKRVADLERVIDAPIAAAQFGEKSRQRIKRGIALLP